MVGGPVGCMSAHVLIARPIGPRRSAATIARRTAAAGVD